MPHPSNYRSSPRVPAIDVPLCGGFHSQHAHVAVLIRSLIVALLLLPSSAVLSVAAEPRRMAVVVGVNSYRPESGLGSLAHAAHDATRLSQVFRQAGFVVQEMTHESARAEGNESSSPNLDCIRHRIEGALKAPNLGPEDVVVITLHGHGVQFEQIQADGKKVPRYYFCPADAMIKGIENASDVSEKNRLLPLSELYDSLEQCTAGTKLLIVDACRNDPTRQTVFRNGNSSITLPKLPAPPGGIAAFFSCAAGEMAVEDPKLKQGVFTYFLTKGLAGAADLDLKDKPPDGIVTFTELATYVASHTYDHVFEKYHVRQSPELRGDFNLNLPLTRCAPPVEGTREGEFRVLTDLKLKLRWCPAGKFRMGTAGATNEESPVDVHLTTGFWMGETEVTQAQWQALMKSTPWKGKEAVKIGADFPATHISHGHLTERTRVHKNVEASFERDSASEFCRQLTESEHLAVRLPPDWKFALPTDAEWEYACRAGTDSKYCFGDKSAELPEFGWFESNADRAREEFAHAVGLKRANAWGLLDMHGNVWEWCADGYSEHLPGGRDPFGLMQGLGRVRRGGGWSSDKNDCRSVSRYGDGPTVRSSDLGFRVALVRRRSVTDED